jgi:hypothetical protein
MRALAAGLLFVAATLTAGCAARQVEVSDGPSTAQQSVAISVTNSLAQAVNIYVMQGSSETFVRQLPANSTQLVTIPGVGSGSTVTLRARTVDGTRTFTSDAMSLTSGQQWRVP